MALHEKILVRTACRWAEAEKVLLWRRTSYVIYAIFIYNLCRIVCRDDKVFISICQLFKYLLLLLPAGHVCLFEAVAVGGWRTWRKKCKCCRFGQMEIICTLRLTRMRRVEKSRANLGTPNVSMQLLENGKHSPWAMCFLWLGLGLLASRVSVLLSKSSVEQLKHETAGDC